MQRSIPFNIVPILIISIALLNCGSQAESPGSKKLLKYTQNWQTSTENGWKDIRQVKYTYNEDKLLTEEAANKIQGDSLVSEFRLLREYNENGQMNKIVREQWVNGEWIFATKSTFSLDSNKVTQRIDSVGGLNAAVTLVSYNYDSLGRLSSELGRKIIEQDTVNQSMVAYTYNDRDLPIQKEFPRWSGETWVHARKMSLTYNKAGHHVQTIRFNWVDDQWRENIRYLLEVDADGNRLSELWQRPDEKGKEDFMRVNYTFNKRLSE